MTNTLTTTTADVITLTQPWERVVVTNHDAAEPLYVRTDGTTAVGEADNNFVILATDPPLVLPASINASNQVVVSVVGSGNKYTIMGLG